jgi:uncharacterized membrane protein YwzB
LPTHNDTNHSIKKPKSHKKSIISVIVAILLISSAVTLSQSPFQKASAQKKNAPLTRLPSSTTDQGELQTTTSNPIKKKSSQDQLAGIIANANHRQQQQQSNQGEGEGEHKQNKGKDKGKHKHDGEQDFVPIAISGNNVYVTWWSNKSGDWEVFFKASTDSGKTFGPKINLSNSTGVVSDNAQIAASENNVYVSWWERANQTSNEPVMRISNDNGKTFGDRIMLSNNATTTTTKP